MSISRFTSLLAAPLFALAACGSEGPIGEMGDPGPQGPMGTMGTPGSPGTNGTNGTNGASGMNGLACWDLNANGVCDLAMEDIDDDTACDVADCAGPPGPQGAPGTPGASGTAGQNATSVFGTAGLTLSGTVTTFTAVPGLTQTLTVPTGHVALIMTEGGVQSSATLTTEAAAVDVSLFLDGAQFVNGGYQRLIAPAAESVTATIENWKLTIATPIAAGSHTFDVRVLPVPGSVDMTVSGTNASVLQGTLTVLLLKQ